MGFYSSFIQTAIHSLWQSAIIVFMFETVNVCVKQMHPLHKRNLLYCMLGAQFFVSAITFAFYFAGNGVNSSLSIVTSARFLPASSFLYQYADMIVYLYMAVVMYKLTAILFKRAAFKSEYSKALVKASPELKIFTDLKAIHLGIKKRVTLVYNNTIHSPLTFGFLKPVILLPFSLVNCISSQEAEAIILHELAHIKSNDYLLNHLLIIAETLYFFNPFIKIVAAKIKAEREKNCDVQVMQFNYSAVQYAETLLKAAKLRNVVYTYHLGAINKKPMLLQRIRFFSAEENLVFRTGNSAVITLICSFLFIASTVFLLPAGKTKNSSIAFTNILVSEKAPEVVLNKGIKTEESPVRNFFGINNRVTVPAKIISHFKNVMPAEIPEVTENALPVIKIAYSTPDSTKEFIYNVETKEGKLTQSFILTLHEGQWVLQPKWMILETNADSTLKTPIPVFISDSIQ